MAMLCQSPIDPATIALDRADRRQRVPRYESFGEIVPGASTSISDAEVSFSALPNEDRLNPRPFEPPAPPKLVSSPPDRAMLPQGGLSKAPRDPAPAHLERLDEEPFHSFVLRIRT